MRCGQVGIKAIFLDGKKWGGKAPRPLTPRGGYLTTRKIANLCGVSPTTIIRWIESGDLKAFKLPSGHRRVLLEELIDFLQRFDMPIPQESDTGMESATLPADSL